MDGVYKEKEINEMFDLGEIKSLDDIYMIEDVALIIKDLNHRIDIQKEYKKKRNEAIKNEITVLENKIDFYKKVIYKTLKDNNETKITFPDSCKISSRKAKPNWVIDDEELFIKFVKKVDEKEKSKELDVVTKKIEEYQILKAEANKLLDAWEKSDKIEETTGVHRTAGEPSVSISYIDTEEKAEDIEIAVPMKEQNFDELEM
jgi:hypothetical protein